MTQKNKLWAQVHITHESCRALKAQAAREGRTMQYLVSMMIMDYCNAIRERGQSP